jgi:hypothetical protein
METLAPSRQGARVVQSVEFAEKGEDALANAKKHKNRVRKRRRKLVHPLPLQREHKPVMHPQMMARERILTQLSDLISACEELFAEHGEACSCEACCLVGNLVGSLRIFRMILEIT